MTSLKRMIMTVDEILKEIETNFKLIGNDPPGPSVTVTDLVEDANSFPAGLRSRHIREAATQATFVDRWRAYGADEDEDLEMVVTVRLPSDRINLAVITVGKDDSANGVYVVHHAWKLKNVPSVESATEAFAHFLARFGAVVTFTNQTGVFVGVGYAGLGGGPEIADVGSVSVSGVIKRDAEQQVDLWRWVFATRDTEYRREAAL